MKKVIPFLFILVLAIKSTAQNCGLLQAYDYLYKHDPAARQRVAELIKAADEQGRAQARPNAVTNYTIPVVFHVLHLGGTENISDAQIQDQINIMNIDYSKQNADTANAVAQFQGLIGNPKVEFRLASIDPNGNCTNGITRHYDVNTDWTVDFTNYIYTWDRTKYMNIYVVRTMPAGSAAYSYYPGTVPPNADAIIVRSDYVGSIGTGQPYTSRIITHEAGHWMNLQHLWGSTNQPGVACGDDGVGDTPITKGHTFCDLANPIVCTPNVTENIQNYMEYAYCQIMFTPGQCTRMQTALNSGVAGRNNIWSITNLIATGVLNPNYNCAPIAEFVTNDSITCVGNSITFLDASYNGAPTFWQWSSSLASNVSYAQNGQLNFANPGQAAIKLKVSNAAGADSIIHQNVLVLAGPGSGSVNVVQGFETGPFPGNGWLASTPQYGSGFVQTSMAAYSGSTSIWVNNYFDNPNGPVSFYTPACSMQYISSAQLTFFYAYAQKDATNTDRLRVYASQNCGSSWTQIYEKSGSALQTISPSNTPYTNPAPGEWLQESIDLSALLGNPQVYYKFEFTPDTAGAGNNIFIDNINIDAVIPADAGFQERTLQSLVVSPNPFSGSIVISGEGLENIGTLELTDITGRRLVAGQKPQLKNNALYMDDLATLSNGVYFLRATTVTGGSRIFKMVKD